MIKNFKSLLPKTLVGLIDLPITVYPDGSHFYGNADVTSGWDFFIDEKDEPTEFLKEHRFIEIKPNDYVSQNLTKIWSYDGERECDLTRIRINVMVVKDLKLQLAVQRIIQKLYPQGLRMFPDQTKRYILRTAFASYVAGKTAKKTVRAKNK